MNKLIEKVLTDKSVRNASAMSAFMLSVAVVATPWHDAM